MTRVANKLLFKDIYLFLVSVLLLFMFWEFLSIFLSPWLIDFIPQFKLFVKIFILLLNYFSYIFILWSYRRILHQPVVFGHLMAIFFPVIYFLYKYMRLTSNADVPFLLLLANSFILMGLLVVNFRQLKKNFYKF